MDARKAVIAGIFAFSLAPAWAQTGNSVLAYCVAAEQELPQGDICLGMVNGYVHMHTFIERVHNTRLYCMPGQVTIGQALRIYVRFLQNNPDKTHQQADDLFAAAMVQQFPCRAK